MQTYFPILPFIIMLARVVIYVLHQGKDTKGIYDVGITGKYEVVNTGKPIKRRYKMKMNFTRKTKNVQVLFNGHYIDAKALYVLQFNKIPSICFIGNMDTKKTFDYITEKFRSEIVAVYQHAYFDHDKQEMFFNYTLCVMTGNRMIEIGPGYVHALYEPKAFAGVKHLMKALAEFKMATVPTYQTKVVGFAREPEM